MLKNHKAYTIDAKGRIAAHYLEAASKNEARQIVEAACRELTVMTVFEVNEVGAVIG